MRNLSWVLQAHHVSGRQLNIAARFEAYANKPSWNVQPDHPADAL